MARYPINRHNIDATCATWRNECLIADGSLLNSGDDVWTPANVNDLYDRVVGAPLVGKEGGGTFESKLEIQLEGASGAIRQLAGEMLLVYLLFPSSISRRRKHAMVQDVLGSQKIDESLIPVCALGEKIGNPGAGFNMRRDLQVGFLLAFAKAIKALPVQQRSIVLTDPWATRDLAEQAPSENRREMMHIVLNLLHPDHFERIASGSHKRSIARAFAQLLPPDGDPSADLNTDETIWAIRSELEELLPEGNTGDGAVDFYAWPLNAVWNSRTTDSGEGTTDLDALEWKKQIILYGPPGTGKTYQARQLAQQVISKAALKRWGIDRFLHEPKLLADQIKSNYKKIQLHPAYGYSEFIRGVRLVGNETRYEPGALCTIAEEIRSRKPENGLAPLPVVLLLDEINRTDLSAMLGEAFTLLEPDKRDDSVELPGINPGELPVKLVLPDDLYIVGTMNEIDQSVETLDFALRRRFLWSECRFDREALLEIIAARWETEVPQKFTFEEAQPQIEKFADNAEGLNDAIARLDDLGRPYEIGHSYFADVTFFLGNWLEGRNKTMASTPLWRGNGQPRQPVKDLWSRSLRPLLEQYLLGADQSAQTLAQLERSYLGQ